MSLFSPPLRRASCAAAALALLCLPWLTRVQGGDSPAPAPSPAEFSKAFTEVAKKAVPAVVYVEVEQTVAGARAEPFEFGPFGDPFEGDEFFERFFRHRLPKPGRPGLPRKFFQQGQGSGFIISADGRILTNSHVVRGADRITVKTSDGRSFKATVAGADEKTDVAVIKVEGKGLPFLPLGDSDALEVGEWVVAVGNPFGLTETVTAGVVSAKGRSRVGVADYEDFIQTDAAINPGNSGGPLLDLEGRVVGINTAIYSRSGGSMGVGFAIPIKMAAAVKDALLKDGKVTRGYLGIVIQDLDPGLADAMGVDAEKGVVLAEVVAGAPAEKAGLKAGDVVLRLEGKAVEGVTSFRNEVAATRPGTSVTLSIRREKEEKEIVVAVGEPPAEGAAGAGPAEEGEGSGRPLGLRVHPLTEGLARELGYERDSGVLVASVDPGSPAAREGIQEGDLILSVNRRPVRGPRDFEKAVRETPAKRSVLLLVKSGKGTRWVAVRPE